MPTTSATTHKLADVRLAQQLLGLLPRIGPVWQAAVRDTPRAAEPEWPHARR